MPKITGPMLGNVVAFSTSIEDLVGLGDFPDSMYTLAALRAAYHNPSTGIAHDIHSHRISERLADVIDLHGANELPNGFLRVKYIQKPRVALVKTAHTEEDTGDKYTVVSSCSVSGGRVHVYDCPPDGFAVPNDGVLWHPETGAAVATTDDREKAVKLVAKYIEQNHSQFAHMRIPEEYHRRFAERYGEHEFNPEKLTPEQLAHFITSGQYRATPSKDLVCMRFIVRTFSDYYGPFGVFAADMFTSDERLGTRFFGTKANFLSR
jgi:hypothetical protein